MALQGTIDTFDLTEVIRMLAIGGKTGKLGLSGDRGSGSMWFADGQVVASETDSAEISSDHAAVLFQLLRFETGSFVFDQGAEPASTETKSEAEPIIDEALRRLEEWTEISAVVPSLMHHVELVTELSRPDVVIDQPVWRAVASIGGGSSVAALGRCLEQDELDVSRTVKGLVELGLVEVSEPEDLEEREAAIVDDADTASHGSLSYDGENGAPPIDEFSLDGIPGIDDDETDQGFVVDEDDDDDETAWPEDDEATEVNGDARDQLDALASGFGLTDEPFAGVESETVDEEAHDFAEPEPLPGAAVDDAGSFPIEEAEAAGEATTPLFAHDAESAHGVAAPAPGEAAEVARQLANLSPEAARAVAAAARATTEEEREAALAQVADEGDEPLDPDLLRSFLASVKQ